MDDHFGAHRQKHRKGSGSGKNADRRKEKSRYAARDRRGKETDIFTDLQDVLPVVGEPTVTHVDRIAMLRVAVALCRVRCLAPFLAQSEQEEQKGAALIDESQLHEDDQLAPLLDGFVLVLNAQGCIVYISASVSHFLGLTQTDLIGRDIRDFTHAGDYRELCLHPFSDAGTINFVLRIKSVVSPRGRNLNLKSASYKPISFIVRSVAMPANSVVNSGGTPPSKGSAPQQPRPPGPSDRVLLMYGAPDMLQGSHGQPSTQQPQQDKLMVTRHTCDMRLSYCSDGVSSVLGYDAKQLVACSFYDLVHPDHLLNVVRDVKTLLAKGHVRTEFYRLLHATGEGVVWVQTEASTVQHTTRGQKGQYVVCRHQVLANVRAADNSDGKAAAATVSADQFKFIQQQPTSRVLAESFRGNKRTAPPDASTSGDSDRAHSRVSHDGGQQPDPLQPKNRPLHYLASISVFLRLSRNTFFFVGFLVTEMHAHGHGVKEAGTGDTAQQLSRRWALLQRQQPHSRPTVETLALNRFISGYSTARPTLQRPLVVRPPTNDDHLRMVEALVSPPGPYRLQRSTTTTTRQGLDISHLLRESSAMSQSTSALANLAELAALAANRSLSSGNLLQQQQQQQQAASNSSSSSLPNNKQAAGDDEDGEAAFYLQTNSPSPPPPSRRKPEKAARAGDGSCRAAAPTQPHWLQHSRSIPLLPTMLSSSNKWEWNELTPLFPPSPTATSSQQQQQHSVMVLPTQLEEQDTQEQEPERSGTARGQEGLLAQLTAPRPRMSTRMHRQPDQPPSIPGTTARQPTTAVQMIQQSLQMTSACHQLSQNRSFSLGALPSMLSTGATGPALNQLDTASLLLLLQQQSSGLSLPLVVATAAAAAQRFRPASQQPSHYYAAVGDASARPAAAVSAGGGTRPIEHASTTGQYFKPPPPPPPPHHDNLQRKYHNGERAWCVPDGGGNGNGGPAAALTQLTSLGSPTAGGQYKSLAPFLAVDECHSIVPFDLPFEQTLNELGIYDGADSYGKMGCMIKQEATLKGM